MIYGPDGWATKKQHVDGVSIRDRDIWIRIKTFNIERVAVSKQLTKKNKKAGENLMRLQLRMNSRYVT